METQVEQELKEKSKEKKKVNKVSKLDFIVNLYLGKAGREGDLVPLEAIQSVEEIAKKVKEAEEKGYFRVRTDTKIERDLPKYVSETKWYLTQAAKKGLISREYNPRKKGD